MPFLTKTQLSLEIVRQGEQDLRDRLRRILDDPTLPADRRKKVREVLAQISEPRVYNADSPPKPGAIPNNVVTS